MAKGRGGGKTPIKVVELLEAAVAKSSIRAVARQLTLTQSAIHRYLQGIGEPSQSTLQKLADYFDVSVAYLRGEVTYNDTSRREEIENIYVAIRRVIDRGNLSDEDIADLNFISAKFTALTLDAFQFENILRHEEGTREALVSKRLASGFKEILKEVDDMIAEEEKDGPAVINDDKKPKGKRGKNFN